MGFTIQIRLEVVCIYLDKLQVALKVPIVLSKEPCCVHVKAPGGTVALLPLAKITHAPVVDPVEVFHQHVIHLF